MQEKTALIKRYHSYLQQGPFIGEEKIYFAALFGQIYSRQIYLSTINNLLCLNPKNSWPKELNYAVFTYSGDRSDMN